MSAARRRQVENIACPKKRCQRRESCSLVSFVLQNAFIHSFISFAGINNRFDSIRFDSIRSIDVFTSRGFTKFLQKVESFTGMHNDGRFVCWTKVSREKKKSTLCLRILHFGEKEDARGGHKTDDQSIKFYFLVYSSRLRYTESAHAQR